MPSIGRIPQETLEHILRQHYAILVFREMKRHLPYVKCLLETGGDWWDNPDCERLLYDGVPEPPPPGPPGEELALLEELLAQMPEDEQRQVATSILKAQARLGDQYIPEIEELIGMP